MSYTWINSHVVQGLTVQLPYLSQKWKEFLKLSKPPSLTGKMELRLTFEQHGFELPVYFMQFFPNKYIENVFGDFP